MTEVVSEEQLVSLEARWVNASHLGWADATMKALVGEVRASRAREAAEHALREHAEHMKRAIQAERDVLQQRIDKAADVLGLIHASLCMLVMDTPEQQALHDRQMEILDRARAALTGTGDIATCPTLCDSDCGEQCHEVHQVPYKRGHSPGGRPALCTVLVAERERVEVDLLTGVDGEWMDDDATVSVADIRRALYCAAEQSGGVQDHVTGV